MPYDGDDCRDNALANLLAVAGMIPPLGDKFGLSESKLNCGLKRGSFNMLMRLRDYNGRSDDPQVRVDWYASPGLQKVPSWTCNDGSDWKKALPWRVSASWRVSQDDLTSDGMQAGGWPNSKYADAKAYVKDGYLVSHLPDDAALRLAGDGMPFRGLHLPLHGGVWMAHLKHTQDTTWILDDGLVAGRAREEDVERSLNEVGFCSGVGYDMFYESLILYARENADVLANGTNDADAMCDALSVGLAFQAAQITPGPAGSVEPIVTCCAPDMPTADCVADCGDGKVSGNEKCDTAIAEGASGACPTSCTTSDPCQRATLQGDGCYARCALEPVTAALSGDGCCPKGANPARDDDCKTSAACGNGVLEAGETCDPPGSCAPCATFACVNVEMTGAANSCNLSCKYSPVSSCQAGDGCCPEGCDHAHDSDCSDQCGNGTVDPGETCEPDVAGKGCPTSCDDNNPCTIDIATGNAATCNRACNHMKIAQAIDGDGCCPTGINANANSDSDCTPMCGNGVTEPGEECDDGNKSDVDSCTSSCKMVDPVSECLKRVNLNDACSKCVCSKCQEAANSCYANSDKRLSDACVKLARCFRVSHCTGFDCYCAQDWLNCENSPSGPCRAEIEAAAGSDTLPTIVARLQDDSTALGLANVVGSCGWDRCASECGN
jgi:cysteine-rich repeat protein